MTRKANELKKFLESTLLVKHPIKTMNCIWDHAKSLNPSNPADAFVALSSLKLVGPFDYFSVDKENLTKEEAVVRHRYATDLPEMETIMVYEGGRFCFWRDTPTDSEPFLMHVSHESEHFPKMEIIGDHSDLFAALYCVFRLMAPTKTRAAQLMKLFPGGDSYNAGHYETLAREAKRRRSRATIGQPFHGLGIRVTVKNDVGYRPVTDNLKRLKREIETMATTDNESLRQTIRANFLEIHSNVQLGNDEKDFGMGLEFGHDVFVANYERFDGLAKSVLLQAYRLLARDAFADILEAHYAAGRRTHSAY